MKRSAPRKPSTTRATRRRKQSTTRHPLASFLAARDYPATPRRADRIADRALVVLSVAFGRGA